jgi:hypothetical protein
MLTYPARTLLSFCAFVSASIMCYLRKHFVIVPSDPSTYASMTHHRCGWVLMVTFAWCAIEMANFAYRAVSLRRNFDVA